MVWYGACTQETFSVNSFKPKILIMQTQGVATKEKLFPQGLIIQVLNKTCFVMKECKLHNRVLRKKCISKRAVPVECI